MKFITILLCAALCFAALLGSAQGDVRPDPDDCSKFWQCDANVCTLMSCGPGTEFNPSQNTCNYPLITPPGCVRHG